MTTQEISEETTVAETETGAPDGIAPLPMGVGQFSRGWMLFFVLAAIGTIVGFVGFLTERSQGMVATGMRDLGTMGGATWGLYISLVVYFVGVSFAGSVPGGTVRDPVRAANCFRRKSGRGEGEARSPRARS